MEAEHLAYDEETRASAFPYMQFIMQFSHLQANPMEAWSSDQQTWSRVQREWVQRNGMNGGMAWSVLVEPTTQSFTETFKNFKRRVNWKNYLMESGNQVEGEQAGGGECQNKEMQEFYCCTNTV